jgi:hypothetical protein
LKPYSNDRNGNEAKSSNSECNTDLNGGCCKNGRPQVSAFVLFVFLSFSKTDIYEMLIINITFIIFAVVTASIMTSPLVHEKIWFEKGKYDEAERQYYENLAKVRHN